MPDAPDASPDIWLRSYRLLRRLVVAVCGLSVLLFGLALLVLPGPAFVVIPVGLGILAIEFEWARWWLKRLKAQYEDMRDWTLGTGASSAPSSGAAAPGSPGDEGAREGRPDQPKMPSSTSTPTGQ